jgi:hypothetical protein
MWQIPIGDWLGDVSVVTHEDPYKAGLVSTPPYGDRRRVRGRVVVVLKHDVLPVTVNTIWPRSRALKTGEIHEMRRSTEDISAGDSTRDLIPVAFFEVTSGGVVVVGDRVMLHGSVLGEIAGFDETHMPNHMNIVLKKTDDWTSLDSLKLEEEVFFG